MSQDTAKHLDDEKHTQLTQILNYHNQDSPEIISKVSEQIKSLSSSYCVVYTMMSSATTLSLSKHKRRLGRLHKHASKIKSEFTSMDSNELQLFAYQAHKFIQPEPLSGIDGLNACASWMNWLADATHTISEIMGKPSPGQPLRKNQLYTVRYLVVRDLARVYEDILGEPPASNPASLFHELVILTLEIVTGILYQDLGHLVRDALAGKEIPDCKYG